MSDSLQLLTSVAPLQHTPPLQRGDGPTEPTLTKHAKWQMERRKIPREAIVHVLNNYQTSRPAPRREGAKPAIIYVGAYGGRDLKVYVVRESSPPEVTTVVWEGD